MSTAHIDRTSGFPAFMGGAPVFPEGLRLANPKIDESRPVAEKVNEILASGVLTNGPNVREFEQRAAEYLGVRNVVAVSSCTAGLMLVMRASGLTGDVIVPSFTFMATAHAVQWNGLRPIFADISPDTLTLSPKAAQHACGVRVSAILATHLYGTPCDVEALSEVAQAHGIKLFFDAAHAFGSLHRGVHAGNFGEAEVFSLSPTKVLVAAEGGVIATNDDILAERLKIGRDYGNPGDYNCQFVGLNARMSELHASVALQSLAGLEERVVRRNEIAAWYYEALADVPGIRFPIVPEGDRSTFKDFTVLVDQDDFGVDAATVAQALDDEGIETRRYYSPPVHMMQAYRSQSGHIDLPVTTATSASCISLPLWVGMTAEDVERVAHALLRIRTFVTHARHQRESASKLLRSSHVTQDAVPYGS